MFNRLLAVCALVAALFLASAPANATPIWFSGTSGGNGPSDVSFSGVFDATWMGSFFQVTSVTGQQSQGDITSAITGLSSYADADQKLSGSPTNLMPDFSGISWTTASLGAFNWFTNGGAYELSYTRDNVGYAYNGTLLVQSNATVPEPLTLSLFGAGLFGLALLNMRKRHRMTAI